MVWERTGGSDSRRLAKDILVQILVDHDSAVSFLYRGDLRHEVVKGLGGGAGGVRRLFVSWHRCFVLLSDCEEGRGGMTRRRS